MPVSCERALSPFLLQAKLKYLGSGYYDYTIRPKKNMWVSGFPTLPSPCVVTQYRSLSLSMS